MMQTRNPYYEGPTRKRILETIEIRDLSLAIIALTFAFAFFLANTPDGIPGRIEAVLTQPILLIASFIAVSSGFVLHELAHKFVAQRYGCWAEFRAQPLGLGIAMVAGLVFGILFALPGAVLIRGPINLRQNGIISLAGPATNFLLALLTIPAAFFEPTAAIRVIGLVGLINAGLCLFNLIPFGPFDGKKIIAWSKPIWASLALASLTLVFFLATRFNLIL